MAETRLTAVLIVDASGAELLEALAADPPTGARPADVEGLVVDVVARSDGALVRAAGHAHVAVLPSLEAAFSAACAIQTSLDEAARDRGADDPPQARLAIALGPPHPAEEPLAQADVRNAVRTAARVVARARAGEVLLESSVLHAFPEALQEQCRPVQRGSHRDAPQLYEVRWRDEPTTPLARLPQPVDARLRIRDGHEEWIVGEVRPQFRIGRGPMNECRMDNEFVSRRHARLEYREGKFFLTDQSTNGIMVVSSTGRRLYVHRETVTLEAEGRMHVGRMDENTLVFVLETRDADGAPWLPVRSEEPPEVEATAASGNVLRQEGEYWTIAFAGSVVRMKDSRGLQFLAWLLRHPGDQIHVLDLLLAASDGAPPPTPAPIERTYEPQSLDGGSVGPLLDAKAKSAYRERLGALKEELAEAERFGDIGRATRAREELDFLAHQLAGALGLGGRDREIGSSAERARVAVTMRIRDALKRIRLCHPKLATHLAASVKTGRFCSYGVEPARAETWTF